MVRQERGGEAGGGMRVQISIDKVRGPFVRQVEEPNTVIVLSAQDRIGHIQLGVLLIFRPQQRLPKDNGC